MIEISTENVKRIVIWLKPELLSRMDGWLETANCKNRSEFITKALRFYMGYLATDDVGSYVCESVSQNIRGILTENTNRISKLMFKWSVELNMMMHIVAAHFKDDIGDLRHAHKRSTNSEGKSFRQNVEGSDPKHSFNYTGTDGSLYVLEAPIDLLSYISLYPSDWQAHSYVACCGTSIQPVLEQLRRQDVDSVYLCLDNDSAGQKAAQRMEAELSDRGIYAEIVVPTLKDWNDDLRREAQEWTQTSGLSL